MEDMPATTPPDSPLPEGNADPGDPLRPEIEEEDAAGTPPLADPHQDMDATEENLIGQVDAIDENETNNAAAADGNASDDESILSEIDEAQFADFDPAAIAIEEREEIPLDDSNINRLQSHKRKRPDGEDPEKRRKKKEGRREKKPKRRKARDDEDDDFTGGDTIEGKRVRKRKEIVPDGEDGAVVRKEKPRARERQVENEANLTPEERMSFICPSLVHKTTKANKTKVVNVLSIARLTTRSRTPIADVAASEASTSKRPQTSRSNRCASAWVTRVLWTPQLAPKYLPAPQPTNSPCCPR